MTELSLNILDLCQNCVRAEAMHLSLDIMRRDRQVLITIKDDGCGMDEEALMRCTDPFFTTRRTRRVGLGLPLMKERALMSGGGFCMESAPGQGTAVHISMRYDHPDCPPMGDLIATVQALAVMERPCLHFRYEGAHGQFSLDMENVREILGGVPVSSPGVFRWIEGYLKEGFCRADGAEALNAGELFFGGAYTMKSVAELEAIRLATLDQVNLRREHADASHVVVGMGTCGIAAGAREVLKAFMAAANEHGLLNMTIAQTGCMGNCDLEPVVEVSCPGMEKVVYTKVTPEMAARIVAEHVVGGKPVV